MQIIHIIPVKAIETFPRQDMEMYLAHLVLKYPETYYTMCRKHNFRILDNSFNELLHAVDLKDINEAAELIRAHEIVLPDAMDPVENLTVINKALNDLKQYPYINRSTTKKMAVLHANDYDQALKMALSLAYKPGISTIGLPKTIAEMAPNMRGRILVADFIHKKTSTRVDVHFLGGIGLDEFVGSDLKHIRSTDSGWYLRTDDPRRRPDILSPYSLEDGSFEEYMDVYVQRAMDIKAYMKRWCINGG